MPLKLTILQRGGTKHHEVLDRAARHFLRQRMSARMVNTLSVRIEVRATKLGKGTAAHVLLDNNGSEKQEEYTIVLHRERLLYLQLMDLAHEVVHVEQAATRRLQVRKWKTDGLRHARWEGQEMGPYNAIPYATRPWEVEASAAELPMLRAFLAHDTEVLLRCGTTIPRSAA